MQTVSSSFEAERLESLRSYKILDTLPERDFDEIAEAAAGICETAMASIGFADDVRLWFKSRIGLSGDELELSKTICSHAILQKEPLIVADARDDARFSDNPFVKGAPQIRFYAGFPLINAENHALGTLCVFDSEPRTLTTEQETALKTLAHQVVGQLELRKTRSSLEETISKSREVEAELRKSEEFKTRLIEGSHECIKVLDLDGRLLSMNEGGMQILEICDFEPLRNSVWVDFWKGEDKDAAIAAVEAARQGGVGQFVGFCPSMTGRPMWWDVIVNPILDSEGKPEKLLSLSRDITERKRLEQILHEIVEGTAAVTGSEFFSPLVRHLASALEVKYAFATECMNREKSRVRTLAFWNNGNFVEEYQYDIAQTPCKNVIDGEVCHYATGIQQLFPHDKDLVILNAESYIGLPLVSESGEIIGHLAVLDDQPIKDSSKILPVLKVFAARAGAELERLRAEDELRFAMAEVERLKNQLHAENIYLQEEIRQEHNFDEIIGNSPALLEVLQKIERVAPTDAAVLVMGETGTGKELIARAIHNLSGRRDRPLVKINCGAISAGLVESELFGHVKGAFTGAVDKRAGRFELANGGTVFLDEVGELPLETQVKLLRVLQEGEFEAVGSSKTVRSDVRIIAATNRDLEDAIAEGKFRSDLFYRLNVFPISVPPLRERREDIPSLTMFFVDRFSKRLGKKLDGVTENAMNLIVNYYWPGNVRELQNVIERAIVLAAPDANVLQSDLLPDLSGRTETEPVYPAQRSVTSGALQDIERDHILTVLDRANWVIEGNRGAAMMLDIHPNTLRSRMKKLGIERPRETASRATK